MSLSDKTIATSQQPSPRTIDSASERNGRCSMTKSCFPLVRNVLRLTASAVFSLGCSVVAADPPPMEALVFDNVNIVDATGSPVQMFMNVVVRGGKIAQIRAAGTGPLPEGATVIDATGRYLIPGLWDMHTHVTEHEYVEGFPDHKKIIFPLFVANGITGMREMGADWDLLRQYRAEIESGKLLGPRIISCGPMLDGPESPFLKSGTTLVVTTPAQGRNAVRRLHREGVDFIKVQSFLKPEVFYAIIEEARSAGLPVAGHVPFSMSAVEVADAGVRSIEHLTGTIFSKERIPFIAGELLSPAVRSEVIQSYVRNGTWHCPTHVLVPNYINPNPILSRTDERLKYIPDFWVSNVWERSIARNSSKRTPADQAEINAVNISERYALTRALRDAGVRFLAGSDLTATYLLPGFSLHDELVLLTQAGLTTMEALQSATSGAAEFLGLDDELGTIEVGKTADLVLIDGDPIEDIHNTQQIHAVVIEGKLYTRKDLDKILAGVQAAANKSPRKP